MSVVYDEFALLVKDEGGIFHGHHCPMVRGTSGWMWWRRPHGNCLVCVNGRYRPQTWHRETAKLPRIQIPEGHALCLPPEGATNVVVLTRTGHWDNWDGKTPGVVYAARDARSFPIAVHTCGTSTQRWNCRPCRATSDTCVKLFGCSNGRPVKPLKDA